jgi:hypothetical protein
VLLALPLVTLGVGVAGQADDQGLGMSPDRFVVATAQPGESYQQTVLLQNRRGFDDTIEVSLEGAAGAWAATEPASPFTIAAGADREILVRFDVPEGAGPGTREGLARFTGQPGPAPTGSGGAVRPSLGLLLNVTVGGEPVVRLTWLDARAEDAQAGDPVRAFVKVRNDGNVAATAEATGQVLPFVGDGPALAAAAGSLVATPGETAEVPVTFDAGLTVGQYRARLGSADGSFAKDVEFKVVAAGQQAPAALLRLLDHEPRSRVDRPLRVDGWFENTGAVAIASARLTVEVRRGGELVEVLVSEPLAVGAGEHANLTAYVTPERAGSYTLSGVATYDGYQTLPRESLLSVGGGGDPWPWWWLLLLVAIALLAVWWAWRKGRKDRRRLQSERDAQR